MELTMHTYHCAVRHRQIVVAAADFADALAQALVRFKLKQHQAFKITITRIT
jgi:hypothetical protein